MKWEHSILRCWLLAIAGALTLASNSLGEYWIGDVGLLLGVIAALASATVALRRFTFPTLVGARAAGVDLVLTGMQTIPFLAVHEIGSSLPSWAALRGRTVVLATLFAGAGLIWRAMRRPEPPVRAVLITTVMAGVVACSATWRLVAGETALHRAMETSTTHRKLRTWDADSAIHEATLVNKPDIFILLLDAYAGDSLLTADYGIDRRAFRDSLSTMGFMPAERYVSNYSRTFASISSMLNFSRVDQVEREGVANLQHSGFLQSLISDSRSMRYLEAAGYDLHWIPAPLFGGRRLPDPDAAVHRFRLDPLMGLWTDSDLIATWLLRVWTPGAILAGQGYRPDLSGARDYALALLPKLVDDGRPSAAVVHIYATHEPLAYDTSCAVDPSAVAHLGQRLAYAAAVRCLDQAMLATFRLVLARASNRTIIVAVGDHAPSSLHYDESTVPLESIPNSVLQARHDAAGFFYVPSRLRNGFAIPRSAVNVMPAVLNAAFNAQIPYEQDVMFYLRPRPFSIHHFTDVTP